MNYHSYKSKMKSLEQDEEDKREVRQRYSAEEVSWVGKDYQRLACDNLDFMDQIAIDMRLDDRDVNVRTNKRVLHAHDCNKRCIVTAPREAMCSNMDMEIEYNVRMTFWLYLVIRVFIGQYSENSKNPPLSVILIRVNRSGGINILQHLR